MAEKSALIAGVSTLSLMRGLIFSRKVTRPQRTRRTYDSLPWLVVHASRDGRDAQLASLAARSLQRLGRQPVMLALADLTFEQLLQTYRALFIVCPESEIQLSEDASKVESLLEQRRVLNAMQFALLDLTDGGGKHGLAARLLGWLNSQAAGANHLLISGLEEDGTTLERWNSSIDRWASKPPASARSPLYR